jgi:spore coat polysaccharide biosynthesis protein SpsF
MLDVGGLPLAELVLRRLARGGLDVILATSREPDDDVLAEHAERSGFRCVRGSLNDVLGRFELAIRDLDAHDLVVRATADNPVPDTALAGMVLASAVGSGAAWVGIDQESVPYGLSLEAVSVGALRAAHSAATSNDDREHVTTWIRRHLATRTAAPPHAGSSRSYRCTVDHLDDYVNAARAFAFVGDPVVAPWRDVLDHFTTQAPVTRLSRVS